MCRRKELKHNCEPRAIPMYPCAGRAMIEHQSEHDMWWKSAICIVRVDCVASWVGCRLRCRCHCDPFFSRRFCTRWRCYSVRISPTARDLIVIRSSTLDKIYMWFPIIRWTRLRLFATFFLYDFSRFYSFSLVHWTTTMYSTPIMKFSAGF